MAEAQVDITTVRTVGEWRALSIDFSSPDFQLMGYGFAGLGWSLTILLKSELDAWD